MKLLISILCLLVLLSGRTRKDNDSIVGVWQAIDDNSRTAFWMFDKKGNIQVAALDWSEGRFCEFIVTDASYKLIGDKLILMHEDDLDTLILVKLTEDSLRIKSVYKGITLNLTFVPLLVFALDKTKDEMVAEMIHKRYTSFTSNDSSWMSTEILDESKYLLTIAGENDTSRQINYWEILEYQGAMFLVLNREWRAHQASLQIKKFDDNGIFLTAPMDGERIYFEMKLDSIHPNPRHSKELVGKWKSTSLTIPKRPRPPPPPNSGVYIDLETYEFWEDGTYEHQVHFRNYKSTWIMNMDNSLILLGDIKDRSHIIKIKSLKNDTLIISKYEGGRIDPGQVEVELVRIK